LRCWDGTRLCSRIHAGPEILVDHGVRASAHPMRLLRDKRPHNRNRRFVHNQFRAGNGFRARVPINGDSVHEFFETASSPASCAFERLSEIFPSTGPTTTVGLHIVYDGLTSAIAGPVVFAFLPHLTRCPHLRCHVSETHHNDDPEDESDRPRQPSVENSQESLRHDRILARRTRFVHAAREALCP